METESRNMEWTGILSVREKQLYQRQSPTAVISAQKAAEAGLALPEKEKEWTTCRTTVTFLSRLGQARALKRQKKAEESSSGSEEAPPKQGFFAALSTASIQGTVELVGVTRTKKAVINGKEGMNVVLERLRNGGVMAVLEGMRRDRLESPGERG